MVTAWSHLLDFCCFSVESEGKKIKEYRWIGLSIIFVDKAILLPCHIVLMTGIGLVIFVINAFIELWFTRKFNTPVKSTNDPDVIDVEAVE